MDQVDVVVVGAGVVGLAVARALAQAGHEVVIVEAAERFGTGTSSRNSEVIHAGLYHEPGSRKARACVRGNALLSAYAAERALPWRRTGKLLVAVDERESAALEALALRAAACGVEDLRPLARAEIESRASGLRAAAVLESPSSGIIDAHAFMQALLHDAEQHGALLAVRSALIGADRHAVGWRVRTGSTVDGSEPFALGTRWLVNAAGLHAQAVAGTIEGVGADAIPERHLARGHYFALSARVPFTSLVYPMPVDGGLGVHLTLDLAGQARFGPDVEWLPPAAPALDEAFDYRVDETRAAAFEAAIRRYWPGLPAGALQSAYTGIRPKLSGPGAPAADFRIDGPAAHGLEGLVQLFGIESPGLTASLALAEEVASIVGRR